MTLWNCARAASSGLLNDAAERGLYRFAQVYRVCVLNRFVADNISAAARVGFHVGNNSP